MMEERIAIDLRRTTYLNDVACLINALSEVLIDQPIFMNHCLTQPLSVQRSKLGGSTGPIGFKFTPIFCTMRT